VRRLADSGERLRREHPKALRFPAAPRRWNKRLGNASSAIPGVDGLVDRGCGLLVALHEQVKLVEEERGTGGVQGSHQRCLGDAGRHQLGASNDGLKHLEQGRLPTPRRRGHHMDVRRHLRRRDEFIILHREGVSVEHPERQRAARVRIDHDVVAQQRLDRLEQVRGRRATDRFPWLCRVGEFLAAGILQYAFDLRGNLAS
jgi:hypothetical protein